jgi:fluoride ion exporter CrcB/FEX
VTVSIIARFAVIALVAAIAAWAPVAVSFAMDGAAFDATFYLGLLAVALLGSFAIGLPVALITFHLSWRQLAQAPITLALVAVLSGVMMMLASFVLLGREGLLALGIPSFIAAATFGLLGWLWIVKPIRTGDA